MVVILFICFIVDPAPVPLEIFTEAQVQVALDQLKGVPAYNEVLALQRLPSKKIHQRYWLPNRETLQARRSYTDALSKVRLVEGSIPPSF